MLGRLSVFLIEHSFFLFGIQRTSGVNSYLVKYKSAACGIDTEAFLKGRRAGAKEAGLEEKRE